MEIIEKGAAILFLVLVVINWIIYHKIFDVYYFGSVAKGFLRELVGCVFAALLEIAIILSVGKWLLGLLIGVGKWFLKTLIVLAAVFVVLILIFVIINNIKKLKEIKSFKQKFKNEPANRSTINSLKDNIIQTDNVESTLVSECVNIENKNEFISSQIKYKENQEKFFCPECGSELLGRNFCTECGTRIRRDTSTPVSDQSNNDNLIKEKIAKERAEHEAEMERQKTEQARLEKERLELEINRKKAEQEQAEEFRIKGAEENRQKSASKYESEKKVENEGKTMALLSLICGILSLVTMGAYFVPEILGIVFACLGKKQGKMRGQAIAGLVCSILSLIIIIGMVIAIIISPSESDGDSRNNTSENTETSVVDEEISEVVESEAKDSEKEEIGTSDEQNRDGVSDEIVNKYGTYSVDNGIDANLEAEVGFYTEDGSDYIKMGALSYGGRYLAVFEGTLIHIDGNTYQAIEYDGNIILEITFDEWGMQVKVLASDFDVIYMLEGYYQKTSELNLNEVG